MLKCFSLKRRRKIGCRWPWPFSLHDFCPTEERTSTESHIMHFSSQVSHVWKMFFLIENWNYSLSNKYGSWLHISLFIQFRIRSDHYFDNLTEPIELIYGRNFLEVGIKLAFVRWRTRCLVLTECISSFLPDIFPISSHEYFQLGQKY